MRNQEAKQLFLVSFTPPPPMPLSGESRQASGKRWGCLFFTSLQLGQRAKVNMFTYGSQLPVPSWTFRTGAPEANRQRRRSLSRFFWWRTMRLNSLCVILTVKLSITLLLSACRCAAVHAFNRSTKNRIVGVGELWPFTSPKHMTWCWSINLNSGSSVCSGNHLHTHTPLADLIAPDYVPPTHSRAETHFSTRTHSVSLSWVWLCPDLLKVFQGRVTQPTSLSAPRLSRFRPDAGLTPPPPCSFLHTGCLVMLKEIGLLARAEAH